MITSSTTTITLQCEHSSPAAGIYCVRNGGSSVLLGAAQTCVNDDERIALARQHGFPTRAERDYSTVVAVHYVPQANAWAVTFDMSDYVAALNRI